MSDNTATTEDTEIGRVGKVFLTLMIWIILGSITAAALEIGGVLIADTVAERFALVTFWPIFAFKYLCLGGWEVLQAFWVLAQS